jgi:hypothetical protein
LSLTRLWETRSAVLRCLSLLVLALTLGSVADSARADATKAQLVWSVTDSSVCSEPVTRQQIEREVEQLVGHEVFVSDGAKADVVLRGGIVAAAVGVRAWFEARDVAGALVGKRELSDETGDCASLQHNAALVLSVLLDRPSGAVDEQPTPPTPRVDRDVFVGAGAALAYGPLPRFAPGFWLSFELGLNRWMRVRADGGYWLPTTQQSPARLGANMSAATGGLALCPAWSRADTRLGFGACLGGQLGAILASPIGLDGQGRKARLLAQATLEVGGSVRVQRRSTLFVAAGPTLALTRPRFYYTTEETQRDVYRPRAVGIIARIGVTIDAL